MKKINFNGGIRFASPGSLPRGAGAFLIEDGRMKDVTHISLILWLVVILLFLILLTSCSSMHGKKTIEFFDPPKVGTTEPILVERTIIEMKQEQYWTDSSRAAIKVRVDDFGEFSMGMSNLDAESVKELIAEAKSLAALIGM